MSDTESIDVGLFEEPEEFQKKEEKPHYATYTRKRITKSIEDINLRLVESSPLWGHLLWNAGIFTADYLDAHAEELVRGKTVLELGAAAALPSLICGINDAKLVVSTDYPDLNLIQNIQYNVDHCPGLTGNVVVEGYIWGNDYTDITSKLDGSKKFDLIILSDLVFNHTEHRKLLKTCRDLLASNGKCLVVFSPHRPKLLKEDLGFFETAKEFGFKSEKIDLINVKPMFDEDEETVEIRSRVYSFFLTFDN